MKTCSILLSFVLLCSSPGLAQSGGGAAGPPPLVRVPSPPVTPGTAPANITIAVDGRAIIFAGPIGPGSAARFESLVDSFPGIRMVVLYSSGGLIEEAERIGQVVREKNLNTYVEIGCQSACTLILIAGRDRAASPNARIGFHRPTYSGGLTTAASNSYVASLRSLYDRAGITRSFTDRTFATPTERMWYPSYPEMLAAHVLTRQTLGGETATLSTILTGREDYARIMGHLPLWEPLRRKYPAIAEHIIDAAMAVRDRGGSDQEMFLAVRQIFERSLPFILSDASDELLVRYARLSLEQALAARAISDEACALYAQGRLNIAVTLPRELGERDASIQAEALNSVPRPAPNFTDEEIFSLVREAVIGIPPDQIRSVTEPEGPAPASVRCEGSIAFFRGILALPDPARSMVLRWMLVQVGMRASDNADQASHSH